MDISGAYHRRDAERARGGIGIRDQLQRSRVRRRRQLRTRRIDSRNFQTATFRGGFFYGVMNGYL